MYIASVLHASTAGPTAHHPHSCKLAGRKCFSTVVTAIGIRYVVICTGVLESALPCNGQSRLTGYLGFGH
jgi:hypothetical protein